MSAPGPKRLVVCCDGTWNLPDQRHPTNVTKVALAVAPADAEGTEQRVFYHHGVGSNRRERLRGGAFGVGLSRDVRETYTFLVQNYKPGDELFFFGFSRGAFTARSTVGLVRNAGILRPECVGLVKEAYALYRSRTDTKTPRGREATLFRRSYSHEPRIRFIGVWDTVGALGIPGRSGLTARFNKRWAFHNTDLSTRVDAAYQALAVDERRGPFAPSIWRVQKGAADEQRVEQVWFSGAHSDVGGGYAEHGLSDVALLWMVDRARGCGLAFHEGAFVHEPAPAESGDDIDDVVRTCTRVMPDPHGRLHDSRTGLYRLIRPFDRSPDLSAGSSQDVSPTVVQRHLRDRRYAPVNFIDYIDEVQSQTTGG